MRGSSMANGASNLNGSGPSSKVITGDRLGGEHWWWLV